MLPCFHDFFWIFIDLLQLTSKDFIEYKIKNDDNGEGFDKTDVWQDTSEQLLQALKNANLRVADKPLKYRDSLKDDCLWNVEPDSSCGWEVTSRILLGEDGFTEIAKACQLLNERTQPLKLIIDDPRTSTHVHLGWQNFDVKKLLCVMNFAAYYEPALMSIVAPSRYDNDYCKSIHEIMGQLLKLRTLDQWAKFYGKDEYEKRYYLVNLLNLFHDRLGTVEIRLHNGTLEELKILAWISLWMRILNAVDRGVQPPSLEQRDRVSLPLTTGPEGDIMGLAKYINARAEMVSYFKQRREYVITHSYANYEEYDKLVSNVSKVWDIKLPINQG